MIIEFEDYMSHPALAKYKYLRVLSESVGRLPSDALIVELGCWWGKATAAMALSSVPTQEIHAIDNFKGSASAREKQSFDAYRKQRVKEGFKSDEEKFWAWLKLACPSVVITLGRGEFDSAVVNYPDESIDMLFIDGDHMQTTHDLITWFPKVKTGGIVYCHDVNSKDFTVGEELVIFCDYHGLDWDMDGELGCFSK